MEWLRDPKNQPKVAIGLSVIIVLIGVVIYSLYFKAPSVDQSATTPNEAPVPAANIPSSTPPGGGSTGPVASGPGAPAASAAQPGAQAAADTVAPMEAWRPDPFLPLGYKAPDTRHKPRLPIVDFPFVNIGGIKPKVDIGEQQQELQQPPRRMAGILVNGHIYAILETNGETEIVQPGDTLKDRLAVVDKIERDKVVLRTKDKKPRFLVVRMAASPRAPSASTSSGTVEGRPIGRPSTPEPAQPGGEIQGHPPM